MYEVFQKTLQVLQSGQDCILAIITDKTGSSPRHRGAGMLATKDGLKAGTIGGGTIEYMALQEIPRFLDSKTGGRRYYNMTNTEASNTGMVCGGTNWVQFIFLSGQDEKTRELIQLIVDHYGEVGTYLLYDMSDDSEYGINYLYDGKVYGKLGEAFEAADFEPVYKVTQTKAHVKKVKVAERPVLVVAMVQQPKIHIFGGGHVARALTVALAPLDFEVHIYDDRPDFVNPEDFAPGTKCSLIDFDHVLDTIDLSPQDYIVVATRGHSCDFAVVDQLLDKEYTYFGVIGSKAKSRTLKQHLADQGFTEEQIAKLYSPIGLPIGDNSPAEISISIAAQIIQVKSEQA